MKRKAKIGDLWIEDDKLVWKIVKGGIKCVENRGGWAKVGEVVIDSEWKSWGSILSKPNGRWQYIPNKEDNIKQLLRQVDEL